jgi:WD40 repeat protein
MQRTVSASRNKTLKVWELSSGRELHTLSGYADSVTAVAVTPDGQRAVSDGQSRN